MRLRVWSNGVVSVGLIRSSVRRIGLATLRSSLKEERTGSRTSTVIAGVIGANALRLWAMCF